MRKLGIVIEWRESLGRNSGGVAKFFLIGQATAFRACFMCNVLRTSGRRTSQEISG